MTRDERADIEDAISELLAWGGSDRYRRKSCDIAVAAMREKLAALAPEGATPAQDVPPCSRCVSEFGKVDPQCPTCHGSGRCPSAAPAPAAGSPLPLEHWRSCSAGHSDDPCSCGLAWRVRLATEQEMHAAWRKRAEEAEAREVAAPAAGEAERLRHLLRELATLVRGECPSLLNEDSGGDGRLSLAIDEALTPKGDA